MVDFKLQVEKTIEKASKKMLIKSDSATDYDRLNTEVKEILLHILDNKRITRKSAVELLGVGESKIKALFNYL